MSEGEKGNSDFEGEDLVLVAASLSVFGLYLRTHYANEPCHTSVLTGSMYYHELTQSQSPVRFYRVARMNLRTFKLLLSDLESTSKYHRTSASAVEIDFSSFYTLYRGTAAEQPRNDGSMDQERFRGSFVNVLMQLVHGGARWYHFHIRRRRFAIQQSTTRTSKNALVHLTERIYLWFRRPQLLRAFETAKGSAPLMCLQPAISKWSLYTYCPDGKDLPTMVEFSWMQ
jgi:hypothetical protein